MIILANGIPDLTKESEKALKDWVANGGTLIAPGKAYSWVDKIRDSSDLGERRFI